MSSNLYSQGFGTTSSATFGGNAINSPRAPTSTDVSGPVGNFPVGQLWVDTSTLTSWQLLGFDSSLGITTALWTVLGGGGGALSTLGGDTGIASPFGGQIDILGGTGIVTAAGVNSVTISLIGGDPAIDQIGVDAFTGPGTNPVLADLSGQLSVTGGQTAAGTTPNVIRTDSLAANTYTIEVQRSQAIASSTIADNGVCHFNSSHFSVDANAFVSLAGGGNAIDSIGIDTSVGPGTNPVLPNGSGLITVTGGQLAPASTANVIQTKSIAANSYVVEVQRTSPAASSMVSLNGVSHFNIADFVVDTNGFVSLIASSAFVWNATAVNVSPMVDNRGYFCVSPGGNLTLTLPVASLLGDTIKVHLSGATSFTITQGAGQQIIVGNRQTTAGVLGTVTSSSQGDAITIVCRTPNLVWEADSVIGNLIIF